MFDAQVLAFVVVAAILTVTPGADTMLVLRNVLRGNRKDGVVTTFGICSGLFVHALLSALGVSIILMHSATLFHAVKLVGAGYIIWLGCQSILGAVRNGKTANAPLGRGTPHSAPVETDGNRSAAPCRRCFMEGFLNNMLNPKVAVFYLAFLPQFIGPDDPVVAKSILLAGIHYVMGIIWLIFLSSFIDRARRFITKPSVRQCLDGFCGAVLVALGVRLAMEE